MQPITSQETKCTVSRKTEKQYIVRTYAGDSVVFDTLAEARKQYREWKRCYDSAVITRRVVETTTLICNRMIQGD